MVAIRISEKITGKKFYGKEKNNIKRKQLYRNIAL